MTELPIDSNPSLWRRLTRAYGKLLEILLAACVGILVIPVTLQIISRYTPFIPSYIWTEEMARFLFIWTIMIGAMVGVREAQHFEVDVWPDLSRRSEAVVRITGAPRHPGAGAGVRVGGHRVHAVCLEQDVGAGRPAALADSRRMAGGRFHLDRVRGRTDLR